MLGDPQNLLPLCAPLRPGLGRMHRPGNRPTAQSGCALSVRSDLGDFDRWKL